MISLTCDLYSLGHAAEQSYEHLVVEAQGHLALKLTLAHIRPALTARHALMIMIMIMTMMMIVTSSVSRHSGSRTQAADSRGQCRAMQTPGFVSDKLLRSPV